MLSLNRYLPSQPSLTFCQIHSVHGSDKLHRLLRCSPEARNLPDRRPSGLPVALKIHTTISLHHLRQHRHKAAATTATVQSQDDRGVMAVVAMRPATVDTTTANVTMSATGMKTDATTTEIDTTGEMAEVELGVEAAMGVRRLKVTAFKV